MESINYQSIYPILEYNPSSLIETRETWAKPPFTTKPQKVKIMCSKLPKMDVKKCLNFF